MAGKLYGPSDILRKHLEGRSLGDLSLEARDFRRGRTDRETYFNLYLRKGDATSRRPVVQGLFFMGRGEYIKPWMEFRYDPVASFPGDDDLDLEEYGLTGELIGLLGSMIPPGGSLMVIYGAEPHPLARETERGLKRNFPPMATPLGLYLWKAGFRWFKDWYFPEGWLEGAMKLQATRPLDEEIRARREYEARRMLEKFVAGENRRGNPDPEEARALSRAEEILAGLE
ncbi:DUF1122 family protein [Candidatus Solincola sp.]|nr:DUF1122 family protein [Actinomycetota bacterium]MDI7252416.1 DUF1122 family protein [Actinomycetota bacterium]